MKIPAVGGIRNLFMALLLGSASGLLPAVVAAAPQSMVERSKAEKLVATDRQEIQRVITQQIRAFKRNDEVVAFSYSTPEIRKHFGSSRTFMEMVRDGYSVLYTNTSRVFLEPAMIEGQVIQPLRIVTHDGETLVALYTLERQPDKEWRIGGCELAPSRLQST